MLKFSVYTNDMPVVIIEDFNYIDGQLVDTNTSNIVNHLKYLLFTVNM